MLSWQWYTAATGGIRTDDLVIASAKITFAVVAMLWILLE